MAVWVTACRTAGGVGAWSARKVSGAIAWWSMRSGAFAQGGVSMPALAVGRLIRGQVSSPNDLQGENLAETPETASDRMRGCLKEPGRDCTGL